MRFLVAERIAVENLNDTANMFRYWASLAVGAVLGFFSYLLLIDARLLKVFYPAASIESSPEPSAVSVAIFGGIAGLLAEQLVMAAQRQLKQDGVSMISCQTDRLRPTMAGGTTNCVADIFSTIPVAVPICIGSDRGHPNVPSRR